MAASILVVDDEENIQLNLSQFLTDKGYEVKGAMTMAEARAALRSDMPDIVLLDVSLTDGYGPQLMEEKEILENRPPVIVITAHGDIDMAVEAMKNGAHDFLQKPIELERLYLSIQRASETVSMRRELMHLRKAQSANLDFIVGKTEAMQSVVSQATRAAQKSARILISGESGTGKEVLANYIHKVGNRSNKAFIDLNCAAIQDTMLEAELFGHEARSFTDAGDKKKIGLIEVADNGILFLDEISSMSMDMQAKLLRAIEEGYIRRVGGTSNIKIDVQLISASNRNMEKLISEGKFRDDLYFRLNVLELHLPPLRERLEDIPELVGFFIGHLNARLGVKIDDITPKAMEALKKHRWPGNIRELSHVIEQSMMFCDDSVLDIGHLPLLFHRLT